ncbi:MAG TPA: nuclear transport factor 2 family protein [Candidatus Acidoferrales bacterium]|nr:nuclear transport factor 2 family protein [Candidatus Acidoferrales bacterium]
MRVWTKLAVGLGILATTLGAASVPAFAQSAPPEAYAIKDVLEKQVAAWNRGDIRGFMGGYRKSERTEFVSASGIFPGWQAVLDRYLHSYPDRAAMGRLTFSGIEVHVLCPDAAYVVGKFRLDRQSDTPEGVFTLIFRKFPEGWRIVNDHTTAYPPRAGMRKPS